MGLPPWMVRRAYCYVDGAPTITYPSSGGIIGYKRGSVDPSSLPVNGAPQLDHATGMNTCYGRSKHAHVPTQKVQAQPQHRGCARPQTCLSHPRTLAPSDVGRLAASRFADQTAWASHIFVAVRRQGVRSAAAPVCHEGAHLPSTMSRAPDERLSAPETKDLPFARVPFARVGDMQPAHGGKDS